MKIENPDGMLQPYKVFNVMLPGDVKPSVGVARCEDETIEPHSIINVKVVRDGRQKIVALFADEVKWVTMSAN